MGILPSVYDPAKVLGEEGVMSKFTIPGPLLFTLGARVVVLLFAAAVGLLWIPTASASIIDTVLYNGHRYYLISENSARRYSSRSRGRPI